MEKEKESQLQQIIKKAKEFGWSVTVDEDRTFIEFQDYSPARQDFIFTVSISDGNIDAIPDRIAEYHNDFDVSEEAYIWLDDTGHGKNGAPYDMRDVYNDMEECKKMVWRLYDYLNNEFNQ